MLPKKYRLADRQMFRKVLAVGSRVSGKFFLLAFVNGVNLDGPKIGVIISRKISKKAVVRNRIKRVVYDSVRKFLESIPKESVLVFLAKKLVAEATSKEVSNDVYGIMGKLTRQ